MNKNESDFDRVFKDRGGFFDPTLESDSVAKLTAELKVTLEDAVNYLKPRYPQLPEINFDFIRSNIFNACVRQVDNKLYLGINIGTFFLLNDMFLKMFLSKGMFSNVGDTNIETEDKKILNAVIDSGNVCYFGSTTLHPIDPTRYFYASTYTSFAMNFLIFHECCHIIRGHIGYATNKKHTIEWNEVETNKTIALDGLVSQTLEMDADSFAVNHAHITALSYIKSSGTLDNNYPNVYSDLRTFYTNWGSAIYSFFRLCDINAPNNDFSKNRSHPPPSVRMSLITNNITTILSRDKSGDSKLVLEEILKSITIAEDAFASITFQERNPIVFFLNYPNTISYQHLLIKNWNNVLPLIKPFSYGELPPIVN
jgi:hypothetical protein